jgi:hypothetical protein
LTLLEDFPAFGRQSPTNAQWEFYGPTFSSRTLQRRVQALTVGQYGAAALFGFTWSLGVMQARVEFQPLVPGPQVVHDERQGQEALPTGGRLNLEWRF